MKVYVIYKDTENEENIFEGFTTNRWIAEMCIALYKDVYIVDNELTEEQYNDFCKHAKGKELRVYKVRNGLGVMICRGCDRMRLTVRGCEIHDSIK